MYSGSRGSNKFLDLLGNGLNVVLSIPSDFDQAIQDMATESTGSQDLGQVAPYVAMLTPLGLPEDAAMAGKLGKVAEDAAKAEKAAKAAKAAKNCPTKWIWGHHKGIDTWIRQMERRGWSPQKISEAIENGEKFPAPNLVNPANPATRYVNPTTGKYVVVDDVTQEIIQISGEGFIPKK